MKLCIASSLIFLLCLLTGCAATGARVSRDDDTVVFTAVESAWAHAIATADKSGLDAIESPAYTLINAAGITLTGPQVDAELLNGRLHFDALDISQIRVWRQGRLAVVTGHARTNEHYLSQDNSGDYEFTDIFTWSNHRWMATHAQLTRVLAADK